jgi:exportin-1
MACDTFIKIARQCKRHFVAHQPGENEPFIDEIVRSLQRITLDLTPQQIHTFYEACGHMISAQGQKSPQERLIQDLMQYPNRAVSNMLQLRWILANMISGIKLSKKRQRIPVAYRMAEQSRSSATS